jgi:multiple sugar transport system substrate-binding protein
MQASTPQRRSRLILGATFTVTAAFALAACAGTAGAPSASGPASASAPAGPVTIKVWAQEGQAGEVQAAKDEVAAFNAANPNIKAELTLVPQATYGQTLASTAVDALPDVYEFDGETAAALNYAKKLAPLDGLVPDAVFKGELSSVVAEGTIDGKNYSVSQYDSGLALYGNKAMLAAAGVTDIPTTIEAAWTADEFTAVLDKLAAKTKGGKALDLKEQYAGTWPGYAFTPVVNSAGQPLVKAGKAVGALNDPAVAAALTKVASWRKYVDPNADDKAFTGKRVGLAWVGHWAYPDNKKALGNDLVVIPLPDFGNGTKSGQGSHSWGLGAASANKEAGGKFLEFIMQDKWVDQITQANGAVPANTSVLNASKLYGPGGDLYLYGQQLAKTCGSADPTPACVTVPRTISPAWPVINKQFSDAFWAVYGGADAQKELDKAAKAIDQDAADNNNYQP